MVAAKKAVNAPTQAMVVGTQADASPRIGLTRVSR